MLIRLAPVSTLSDLTLGPSSFRFSATCNQSPDLRELGGKTRPATSRKGRSSCLSLASLSRSRIMVVRWQATPCPIRPGTKGANHPMTGVPPAGTGLPMGAATLIDLDVWQVNRPHDRAGSSLPTPSRLTSVGSMEPALTSESPAAPGRPRTKGPR